MTETTDKMQGLLKTILRRLDDSQRTADERHQAQVAYNDQVSTELKHLAKQIDLTQADVDEARKSPPPPIPPREQPRGICVRYVDDGGLLPTRATTSASDDPSTSATTALHGGRSSVAVRPAR